MGNIFKNKILIIQSTFYEKISSIMINTAENALKQNELEFDLISMTGSLEIPTAMGIVMENNDLYSGVIILGCVIKGETDHFEIVSRECVSNVINISIGYSMPIGVGLISANNMLDAEKRAEQYTIRAVNACIELINIKRKVIQESNFSNLTSSDPEDNNEIFDA